MNLQKRALGRLLASLPLLALANVNAQTPAAAPAAPVSGTLQIISFGGGFNQLATTRSSIGNYMGIVGAARRSWAANNEAQVVGFIRAYRDAIRWLKLPENRPQAQALLMKYVPNMNAQIAAQSCDLLLDQQSGFFSDVQLDDKGIQAVLDLRSNLGDNAKKLTDASKYIDKRYWQKAMQP